MTTPAEQSPWISSTITLNIEINAEQLGIDGVSDFDQAVKQIIADAINGMILVNPIDIESARSSIRWVNATYTRGTDDVIPYTTEEYD